MLILPPGHAQTIRERRTPASREKWILRGVLGGVAVVVVALVIALTTQGHKLGAGCVSVALAYSTGGAQIDRCGASARALCAGVGRSGGVTGKPAETVADACRKAGLPIG